MHTHTHEPIQFSCFVLHSILIHAIVFSAISFFVCVALHVRFFVDASRRVRVLLVNLPMMSMRAFSFHLDNFNYRALILSEQMIRSGGSYSIRIRNDFITTMLRRKQRPGIVQRTAISYRWPNCKLWSKTPIRVTDVTISPIMRNSRQAFVNGRTTVVERALPAAHRTFYHRQAHLSPAALTF